MTATQTRVAFRCDKDALAEKLTLAFRASPGKAALAALSGVLLRAEPGRVVLSATDGELTIQTSTPAEVQVPGEAVLHRLFGDIIRALPAGAVEVSVDESGMAQVSSARSRFSLRTYPRGDFPVIPDVTSPMVELPAAQFSLAVDQAAVAASTDKGRPILMGVLFEAAQTGLRLVATDSYRLAVREVGLTGFLGAGESALLPARALAEVSRLMAGAGPDATVAVGVGERKVAFAAGDTTVTATLIEGDFPSYQQLVPERYPNRLEVAKDVLLDALRRVGLLARDATPVRVTLSSETITLQAIDPELGGEAVEEIDGHYVGEPMMIAFNPTYLREGVEACRGDSVQIETIEPLKPAMIAEPGSREYMYILMPVRV